MATQYEQAAGILQAWMDNNGSADHQIIADDVIEILRICHEYRTPDHMKAPAHDADELGSAIAKYIISTYAMPMKFDEPTKRDIADEIAQVTEDVKRIGTIDDPAELDLPDTE